MATSGLLSSPLLVRQAAGIGRGVMRVTPCKVRQARKCDADHSLQAGLPGRERERSGSASGVRKSFEESVTAITLLEQERLRSPEAGGLARSHERKV